jgi:uncharacterized repeat protein (TIGR01451 family)
VTAGDSFDYTLEVENIGNADATNVQTPTRSRRA